MADTGRLAAAITAVMAEVSFVAKEGTNAQQHYKYAGERHIIAALRPAMVKQGLSIVPVAVTGYDYKNYTTSGGTLMHRTRVSVRYRVLHTSGESIDIEVSNSGMDAADKDESKAHTQCYKYALRQVFCLETGDDPDAETPAPQTAQRQSGKPTAPPAQQPAAAPAVNGNGNPQAMFEVTVLGGEPRDSGKGPWVKYKLRMPDGKTLWASCFRWNSLTDATGMTEPAEYRGPLLIALEYEQDKHDPNKSYPTIVDVQAVGADDYDVGEVGPPLDADTLQPISPGD